NPPPSGGRRPDPLGPRIRPRKKGPSRFPVHGGGGLGWSWISRRGGGGFARLAAGKRPRHGRWSPFGPHRSELGSFHSGGHPFYRQHGLSRSIEDLGPRTFRPRPSVHGRGNQERPCGGGGRWGAGSSPIPGDSSTKN